MFKKEKYELIEGIYTDAIDYDYINIGIKEKLIGFFIGFIIAFLAIQIFFGIVIISFVIAIFFGFKAIPVYRKYLIYKRKKKLLLEFRDLLDSLNNSLAAGDNVNDAFNNALEDMISQHGENAYITKEVNIIIGGLYNNIVIENLLMNFADRSHLEDIKDFCDTFCTCIRLGGNLKVIINDCKEIITQKIDIELEINTIIAGNKNQLNIIILMPFIIIAMMQTMGFDAIMALNFTTITTKIIALIIFILAYRLGLKIIKIEV